MTPVGGDSREQTAGEPSGLCRDRHRLPPRRAGTGQINRQPDPGGAVFVSYKTVFLQQNMTNDRPQPIKQADSDRPQPIDISTRLRQTRANMLGTDDEQHYWDCHEAANKIDRLRSIVGLQDAAIRSGDTLALTESEREAIKFMLRHAAHAADEPAFPDSADYRLHSEALYGLLERTK